MAVGKSLLILGTVVGTLYGGLYILAYPMMESGKRSKRIIALLKSPEPSVETVYYRYYEDVCGKFSHEMDDEFFQGNWERKEVCYYTGTRKWEEMGYSRRREIFNRDYEEDYYKKIIFDAYGYGYSGPDPVSKTGCSMVLVQKFPDREMVTYKTEDANICLNSLAGGIAIRETVAAPPSGTLCRGRDKYTGEFLGRVYFSDRRYYDKEKKSMLNFDGVARETCKKSDKGKVLEFHYYGINEEPVSFRGMMEQSRIFSDDSGNLKRIELLTANGELKDVEKSGYVFSVMETQGETVVLKNAKGIKIKALDIPEFRKLYDALLGGNGKQKYLY